MPDRFILARWLSGLCLGTVVIAVTSPWFVRSYIPRVKDPVRTVEVYQPGARYRWRSEGYATSQIGPMGMVGTSKSDLENDPGARFALWGDSQAEGVCVSDQQKIGALASDDSEQRIQVLPMARSGDDCNDWIYQISALERESGFSSQFDAHVFLVVEWSDWCIDVAVPEPADQTSFNKISERVPAFVIQAARNTLTSGSESLPRKLRFVPGPVEPVALSSEAAPNANRDQPTMSSKVEKLAAQLERLKRQTETRCLFLYAPMVPSIDHGQVHFDDPDADLFIRFRQICQTHQFDVVDLRPAMQSSVRQGKWPRGFHNGQFGVGHYNRVGNQIIASAILGLTGPAPDVGAASGD